MNIEEFNQANTYLTSFYCYNCGSKGTINILKGKKINETMCENCGCKTLEKPEQLT